MRNNSQIKNSFMRLPQIIGSTKTTPPIPPIIPVSSSTWWAWVKIGKAPKPIKLSEKVTAWRSSDIDTFALKLCKED
jgi:prophage regulatory protein